MKVVEKVVEMLCVAAAVSSLIVGVFNADGALLCASALFLIALELVSMRRK